MTVHSGPELTAGTPRTVGDFVRDKAARNGDRVAIEVDGVRRSYAELDERSDRTAAGLDRLGLAKGDHACVLMKNSVQNVDVWFGLCKAGIVEVPVNTASRGFSLAYLLSQSDSRALVVDEEFVERVAEVAAELPLLAHVVVHREGLGVEVRMPAHVTVHELDELCHDGPPPATQIAREDTAVIIYTSGTTGPAKGVLLSHEANLTLARHTVRLCGYTADDVLFTAFPLFHINAKYTSVLAAMAADGRLVMHRRFSASRFWDICRASGVTAFNYQGALLLMLYKQPERPDDADNPVRLGFGAPCPVEIWADFERRFGLGLVEVYGMTEIAIATENPLHDRRIGSAGRASANWEVRIVDAGDEPVPAGVAGEIVVRPTRPSVMIQEYYKMPAATVEAFRNLWFHTGDRGRFDGDGFLYFVDRMKDAIRRRGENISSWEVEKVLNAHPDVLEAAAYGVPSELTEEEVMIAVVRQPDRAVTPEALLDHAQVNLAHFAVPRYVRFLDELPKTPSQRIEKYRLRADGVTADTWDRDQHGYLVHR